MKIGFYGAARQVTGSKHLIMLDNGKKILLDCGMFQGEGEKTDELNGRFRFAPHEVDCMVLSHAHIDHSGLIPRLCKQGFKGRIYCTSATKDLCGIMLEDSAEIQEEDFRHLVKHHLVSEEKGPLYTIQDARNCMKQFYAIDYNEDFSIMEGVVLRFTDAGHILGSAAVNLAITEQGKTTHLTFTGDVGRYERRILRDPQPFPQADVLICGSTYGDTVHQAREEAEEELRKLIIETCGMRKGKLLIPAFSIGRTQDLIYILNKLDFEEKIPPFPVFIDSPLSIEATDIVRRHDECFDAETLAFLKQDPDPFNYPSLTFVKKVQDSRKLNDFHGPCVIIASSGMLEGGRIRHHLIHHIEDERNTLLLSTYADEESLAGRLRRGDKKVEIWDRTYDVRATIVSMDGLSAHADRNELLQYLSSQDKQKISRIFLVHGEGEAQRAFKEALIREGYTGRIEIPAIGDVADIG